MPGLDFTNDPLLAGRIHSYVDTQISRLGGPNFHELPINAPIAQVHNGQRDGMHRQAIHRGRVAYEPNSLAGGSPFQAGAAQGFTSVARRLDAKENADKVRIKPEKFADHYTQAKLFFESQSDVEKAHIGNAFRFELSKVTVPAIRERVVASLLNAVPEMAERLAEDLGMDLPAPLPKALELPAVPEVETSPALSLMARLGDGGIRTRKIAILVAHGVEDASLGKLVSAVFAAGAVPRLVARRLGTYIGIGGEKFAADATLENSPGFMFDALVLPDGAAAVEALHADAHTLEFLRDQYWHCKTILAFGASEALLAEAQIPMTLPDGLADAGLLLADSSDADAAIARFITAVGSPRIYARENDPPKV